MNKQTYQIEINATQETIWDAITNPKKYRIWSYAFNKTSYFKGGWNQGDKIQFLGCDDEGKLMGMSSMIEVSKPHEYISIKHLGFIADGVEDFDSEEVKKWTPAHENYSLIPTENGKILFKAEVDLAEEYVEMFEKMWSEALQVLKVICESMFEVKVSIPASVEDVWQKFTTPESIVKWNFASDDWECPKASNDLVEGGKFSSTMAAKDGSVSFDFSGQYFDVVPHERIAYKMDDGRLAYVFFEESEGQTVVTELVQAETENPIDMQQQGWQAILDNFKKLNES